MSGYAEARAWSEKFTRDELLPFLAAQGAEIPFRDIRVTQDEHGWLQRGIDMVGKADAVANRGPGYCWLGIRCQRMGTDKRTITVRYPQEYDLYVAAYHDPSIFAPGYMVHSYACEEGRRLLAVWVAEARLVVEAMLRQQNGHPTPHLLYAEEDGQPFAHPSGRSCRALRLAPGDRQLSLL